MRPDAVVSQARAPSFLLGRSLLPRSQVQVTVVSCRACTAPHEAIRFHGNRRRFSPRSPRGHECLMAWHERPLRGQASNFLKLVLLPVPPLTPSPFGLPIVPPAYSLSLHFWKNEKKKKLRDLLQIFGGCSLNFARKCTIRASFRGCAACTYGSRRTTYRLLIQAKDPSKDPDTCLANCKPISRAAKRRTVQ